MGQPLISISKRQAFIFAGFFVLYEFLTYIANDMIMPAMVQVVTAFDGSESAIATSLTAYILGGASLQLFLGPLSDRYGRRPVMLFGACLFFICTLLIAFSHSMEQFIAARFLQGMGLCFIGAVGYATIQEIFEEMDAVRLIALMANISILAPAIGPVAGALIIYYSKWQMIFYIIGSFSLLALWGLWRFMPESVGEIKKDGQKIEQSQMSFRVILSNYKQLIQNPVFILGSIGEGILALPCLAWIALAPVILIKEAHLSVIEYSLWQIPLFTVVILGNWLLHRLTHHFSLRKIIFLGSLFSFTGLFFTAVLPLVFGEKYFWLIPGLIIYFFSFGIISAPLNRLILYSTEVSKGTASALLSLLMMFILGLGVEGASFIYKTHQNLFFGFYCAAAGLLFGLCLWIVFQKQAASKP